MKPFTHCNLVLLNPDKQFRFLRSVTAINHDTSALEKFSSECISNEIYPQAMLDAIIGDQICGPQSAHLIGNSVEDFQ